MNRGLLLLIALVALGLAGCAKEEVVMGGVEPPKPPTKEELEKMPPQARAAAERYAGAATDQQKAMGDAVRNRATGH